MANKIIPTIQLHYDGDTTTVCYIPQLTPSSCSNTCDRLHCRIRYLGTACGRMRCILTCSTSPELDTGTAKPSTTQTQSITRVGKDIPKESRKKCDLNCLHGSVYLQTSNSIIECSNFQSVACIKHAVVYSKN
jgi:hypothetical protein